MKAPEATRNSDTPFIHAESLRRSAASATLSEKDALEFIRENVKVGEMETDAVNLLVRAGFACRQLRPDEYGRSSVDEAKAIGCTIRADLTSSGYSVVYASLAINKQGQLLQVTPGSYKAIGND